MNDTTGVVLVAELVGITLYLMRIFWFSSEDPKALLLGNFFFNLDIKPASQQAKTLSRER